MPSLDRNVKRKAEELAAASQKCKKLSSLGFVINKTTTNIDGLEAESPSCNLKRTSDGINSVELEASKSEVVHTLIVEDNIFPTTRQAFPDDLSKNEQQCQLSSYPWISNFQHNRYYIKTLIELIIFCGRQEIALRGHDESDESESRGNFFRADRNY